jgi:tetratricopeptide (TPR) repeat protein
MPVDLTAALEQHRRGELDRAARAYEAALAEDPDHPAALHLLGLVALQKGDPARAVALIGRAIAVRPAEAGFLASLAESYRALGRSDRAVECGRAAVRLRPDSPEIHGQLAAALADAGDLDGAIGHYREALRLRPEFVAAHNNLGDALLSRGDRAAALAHFREAVRLDPASAEARSNLGRLLVDQGQLEEGLAQCREVVRLRPDSAAARVNLGKALTVLGRLDEAEASYREAVRLRPDLAAGHAGLAGVLEQLGDFEGLVASLREAVRLNPRHAGALARLATRLKGALPEPDRDVIEALLADHGLPPEDRWPLLFGLAHVLDARGEFDRAAALTAQANALQLADFRKRGRGYDPAAHRAFVDQLVEAFNPAFFDRVRGFGHESERPVFVVGLPRTGTSLVEQVLASHPQVFGAGELRLALETFNALPWATGRDVSLQDCLDHLDRDAVRRLAHRHLDALAALNRTADRVVDKMPENTLYLGLLADLFPRASFIHCRRDVRDVALSCWMTHFGHVRWSCDPDHIASRIAESRRLTGHWRRVLPVPVYEFDYEAMVADPERVSRELVAHCGLDWDPSCLDFHATRRPVRTASVAQVRRPVYASSVGRWKNYEQPLAALFAKLEDDL